MFRFLRFIHSGFGALTLWVIFVVFTATALPLVSNYTEERIGVAEAPDLVYIQDYDRLYELAEAYGEDGRSVYITMRWTFDIVWPLVYGLTLYATIAWLTPNGRWKHLVWIPVAAVLFDYVENTFATILMAIHPRESMAAFVGLFLGTFLKWTTLGLSFVVAVVLLILRIVRGKPLEEIN